MVTWRELIELELRKHGESFEDIVCSAPFTIYDEWMDEEFDGGFGTTNGCAFTVWTKTRVYFPVTHGGYEGVGSALRNPCNVETRHIGW